MFQTFERTEQRRFDVTKQSQDPVGVQLHLFNSHGESPLPARDAPVPTKAEYTIDRRTKYANRKCSKVPVLTLDDRLPIKQTERDIRHNVGCRSKGQEAPWRCATSHRGEGMGRSSALRVVHVTVQIQNGTQLTEQEHTSEMLHVYSLLWHVHNLQRSQPSKPNVENSPTDFDKSVVCVSFI